MTKALREILAKLETMKQEVRNKMAQNDIEAAEKLMEEVRALQRQADLMKELDEADVPEDGKPLTEPEKKDRAELENAYRSAFLRSLRRGAVSNADRTVIQEYRAAMHEGNAPADPAGDSGLIVPQDIQTKINEIMRQLNPLSAYVTVEPVSTLTGSRVLEADNVMLPLIPVAEMGQIQDMDNPQFVPVQYSLVKRAGVLPITNELLSDTDQDLIGYISSWIARKVTVTHNTLITTLWGQMPVVPFNDVDDLKTAKNVQLDPALLAGTIIITNQDGYNWLDQQVDGTGRYLLQDDITKSGGKMLFNLPAKVISNRYLPTQGNLAPILVGNTKQLTVLFTRGRYELLSTNVGDNAFRLDTTNLRVITRDDCTFWDQAAAVMGSLPV